jgi:hypothetical protein
MRQHTALLMVSNGAAFEMEAALMPSNLDYLTGMSEDKYIKSHLRRALRECYAVVHAVSANDIAIKASGNIANGRRDIQISLDQLEALANDLLKGRWK